MSGLNGDAPVRYRISQGKKHWVVKLSAPDTDGEKLGRWIRDNEIEGEIIITCEWRDGKTWRVIGPIVVGDARSLT